MNTRSQEVKPQDKLKSQIPMHKPKEDLQIPMHNTHTRDEHKNKPKGEVSNINKNKWEDPHQGTRPKAKPNMRRERENPI
jgi:hypothetical protein